MQKAFTKIAIVLTVILGTLSSARPVAAQNFCQTFPVLCGVTGSNNPNEQDAQNYILSRVSVVASLIFIAIILTGVFIVVRAGYSYISSQGNEKTIEQSQTSIKNVFIGIALLFVGIVGIILVISFFGGQGLLGSGFTIDDILRPRN